MVSGMNIQGVPGGGVYRGVIDYDGSFTSGVYHHIIVGIP
jgi:hypothetical protein